MTAACPLGKKHTVQHSEVFDAPSPRVWALLTDWGGIVNWMPDGYIRSLRLEGRGRGAVRHLVTLRGAAVSERLDEMDEQRGLLTLSIVEPMPWGMSTYSAQARLAETEPGRCKLTWRGTFEMADSKTSPDELAVLLQKSYIRMFQGIRNELSRSGRG